MRIVAGEWRGRGIDAPPSNDTRPTIDRVREALFSSLYSLTGGFEGMVVLDAFAGSGALGLEALSRGAKAAVFFENDNAAAQTCKKNIAKLGLGADRASFVKRDVMQAPPLKQAPPFDIVFFDPPYRYDPADVVGLARALADSGALSAQGIVVYEHARTTASEVGEAIREAGFAIVQSKKYGKTGITVFSAGEE